MNQLSVRVARPGEYDRLTDFYRHWGYRGSISAEDIVYVAERSDEILGLVRRTHERAITMLRGMYVDPLNQRQRVGTHLLNAFVADLADAECFCIPFAHLIAFYSGAGFTVVSDNTAPPFLDERAARYRQGGRDVLIMRRDRTLAVILRKPARSVGDRGIAVAPMQINCLAWTAILRSRFASLPLPQDDSAGWCASLPLPQDDSAGWCASLLLPQDDSAGWCASLLLPQDDSAGWCVSLPLLRMTRKQNAPRLTLGETPVAYIVLSGLPGSGKSTVARRLAPILGLSVLDKDDILDALFESLGVGDSAWRSKLSRAADDVFCRVAPSLDGALLVSWWRHPDAAGDSGTPTTWLESLPGRVLEIHCVCPPRIATARFAARQRHAGHLDTSRDLESITEEFERLAVFGPLGFAPGLQISTDSDLDLSKLVASVREHLARA